MRGLRWLVAGSLLLPGAPPLAAQAPECSLVALASTQVGRVCSAAVDAARGFHPVVGLLTSGGAPVPGTGAVQGGLGRVSLALRVNASQVTLPSATYNGTTPVVPRGERLLAPSPVVEAAVGILPGRNGFLGLDVLLSAQLIPTNAVENLVVEPGARRIGSIALGLGYGVRVGLLGEAAGRPAIGLSVMRRHIPRVTYGNVLAGGDAYAFSSNLNAWNVRVVASKEVRPLIVGVGAGWDRFTGDTRVSYRSPIQALPTVTLLLDPAHERWQAFGNAALVLGRVRLTGEVGRQFGRSLGTVTTFEGWNPGAGRWYGVLGLGVGF